MDTTGQSAAETYWEVSSTTTIEKRRDAHVPLRLVFEDYGQDYLIEDVSDIIPFDWEVCHNAECIVLLSYTNYMNTFFCKAIGELICGLSASYKDIDDLNRRNK